MKLILILNQFYFGKFEAVTLKKNIFNSQWARGRPK